MKRSMSWLVVLAIQVSGVSAASAQAVREQVFKDIDFVEIDDASPGTISDLGQTGATTTTVTLLWTTPGDDGWKGHASGYDIRYSSNDPGDDVFTWFMSATPVANEPSPNTANGTYGAPAATSPVQQSFTLTDLNPEAGYYVAMFAFDEVANESMISNVVYVSTAGLPPAPTPTPTPTTGSGEEGGGGGGNGNSKCSAFGMGTPGVAVLVLLALTLHLRK